MLPLHKQPAPPPQGKPVAVFPPINVDCAALARFTRSVALARDAGVPRSDVGLVVEAPPGIPSAPIIHEVFTREDISPSAGESNSYSACQARGHSNMLAALIAADGELAKSEKARLAKELAAKKKKKKKQ